MYYATKKHILKGLCGQEDFLTISLIRHMSNYLVYQGISQFSLEAVSKKRILVQDQGGRDI